MINTIPTLEYHIVNVAELWNTAYYRMPRFVHIGFDDLDPFSVAQEFKKQTFVLVFSYFECFRIFLCSSFFLCLYLNGLVWRIFLFDFSSSFFSSFFFFFFFFFFFHLQNLELHLSCQHDRKCRLKSSQYTFIIPHGVIQLTTISFWVPETRLCLPQVNK